MRSIRRRAAERPRGVRTRHSVAATTSASAVSTTVAGRRNAAAGPAPPARSIPTTAMTVIAAAGSTQVTLNANALNERRTPRRRSWSKAKVTDQAGPRGKVMAIALAARPTAKAISDSVSVYSAGRTPCQCRCPSWRRPL
jgi:hypothetical protein